MTVAALVQELSEFPTSIANDLLAIKVTTPEQLAHLLAAIRDARKELQAVSDVVEHSFLEAVGNKRALVVDDLGEVEIRTEVKRTDWENDQLWKEVVHRALDHVPTDEETGERHEPSWATVAHWLGLCARPSWRITALRDLGIEPDEYCHVEFGAKRVKLP